MNAPSPASKALEEVRQLVAADDRRDFEFAERGFIATRKDPVIPRDAGDGPAFDLRAYDYLEDEKTDETVNPSLRSSRRRS